MARYIDAKEVLNILCDNCKNVKAVCPHYPCEQYTKIEGIPTADVVEVVHCKDCKHFNREEPCVGGTYEACMLLSGADGCGMNVEEDFFCAYGEKL